MIETVAASHPGPEPAACRTLATGQAIDLRRTLSPTRHGRNDPTTRMSGPAEVWRATRNEAGPVTLRITAANGSISADAWGPGADVALDQLPDLVGASDDSSGFTPRHPVLARLAHDFHGLRLCRTGAVLEALVPAILEQKVTTVEAIRAYLFLARAFGQQAPGPGGLLLPVAPAILAATPYFDLHRGGIERKRADTLRRACARAVRLQSLAVAPAARCRDALTSLPGIGPWTAATVTGTTHGDPDAVVVGDYHLPRQIGIALAGDRHADDARMLELLEPYRGHRRRVQRLVAAGGIGLERQAPRARLRSIASI